MRERGRAVKADGYRTIRGPIAPEWRRTLREFWYVKARNVTTGEEIQRLAELADEMFGSSAATSQMKAYLIEAGRAKPDCSDWEIVECSGRIARSGPHEQRRAETVYAQGDHRRN